MATVQGSSTDQAQFIDLRPAFRKLREYQFGDDAAQKSSPGAESTSPLDSTREKRERISRPRMPRRKSSRGDWVSSQVKQIESRVNAKMNLDSREVSPSPAKVFRSRTPSFRPLTPNFSATTPSMRPSTPSVRPSTATSTPSFSFSFRPPSIMRRRSFISRTNSPPLTRIDTNVRPATRTSSRETNSSENSDHSSSTSPQTASTPATQYSRASSRSSSNTGFIASLKRRSQRLRMPSIEHLHSSFKRSISPTFTPRDAPPEEDERLAETDQSESPSSVEETSAPSQMSREESSQGSNSGEKDSGDESSRAQSPPPLEPSHRHLTKHEIRPSNLGLLPSPACFDDDNSSVTPSSPATPPTTFIVQQEKLDEIPMLDDTCVSPPAPPAPTRIPPITPTQVSHIWSHALLLLSSASTAHGLQQPHHAALLESLHTFQSILSSPIPAQISNVHIAAIHINIGFLFTRFPMPDNDLACESFNTAISVCPRGKFTALALFALGCAMFDQGKVTEAGNMWDMCEGLLEGMGVVPATPGGWGNTGWGAKTPSTGPTTPAAVEPSDPESETSVGFEEMGGGVYDWRLERSAVAANKSICKQRIRVEAFMKSEVKWEIRRIPMNFMLEAPDENGNFTLPHFQLFDRSSVELRLVETYSQADGEKPEEIPEPTQDIYVHLQPVMEESCQPTPVVTQKPASPTPSTSTVREVHKRRNESVSLNSSPKRSARHSSSPSNTQFPPRSSSRRGSDSRPKLTVTPPRHSPFSVACSSFYSSYSPDRGIGLGVALENHPALRITKQRPCTRRGDIDLNKPLPPLPLHYPRLSRMQVDRAANTKIQNTVVELEKARIARRARRAREFQDAGRERSPAGGLAAHREARERKGNRPPTRRPKSIPNLDQKTRRHHAHSHAHGHGHTHTSNPENKTTTTAATAATTAIPTPTSAPLPRQRRHHHTHTHPHQPTTTTSKPKPKSKPKSSSTSSTSTTTTTALPPHTAPIPALPRRSSRRPIARNLCGFKSETNSLQVETGHCSDTTASPAVSDAPAVTTAVPAVTRWVAPSNWI